MAAMVNGTGFLCPPAPVALSFCTGSKLPQGYDEEFRKHFLRNHIGLPVVVSLLLLMVVGMYCIHIRWLKLTARFHHVGEVSEHADAMALALLRHLAPDIAIERYRFRGFKRKRLRISVEFQNLGFRLNDGTEVLRGATGEFKAGRVAAILGPSGAGKTTFLNVLCSKVTGGQPTGQVYINGQEGSLSLLKSVRGFVPQDDIVHETLTVGENITFAALLRDRPGKRRAEVHHVVQDVLAVMQLIHIPNSIVGGLTRRGISGGQRKRVNIGMELAGQPSLLFLDEPTSGLDSTSSLIIANSLKKMAELGMTIIMSIHQPRYSLYCLFDDLLLLGKGGRTVYIGDASEAPHYFERLGFQRNPHDNPADWMLDIVSGEAPHATVKRFTPGMLPEWWAARKDQAGVRSPHNVAHPSPALQPPQRREATEVFLKKLDAEWHMIDTDRDGKLDREEMTELLRSTGADLSNEEAINTLIDGIGGDPTGIQKAELASFLLDMLGGITRDSCSEQDDLAEKGAKTIFSCYYGCSAASMGDSSSESGESAEEDGDMEEAAVDSVATLQELQRPMLGFRDQFQVILFCRAMQLFRKNFERACDLTLILGCTLVAGVLHQGENRAHKPFMPFNLFIFHLGLALLICISCLKVFGENRPLYWRMCGAGMNRFAFFCAGVLANSIDVLMQSVIYCCLYYLITGPLEPFDAYFQATLLISFVASGWGYFLSAILPKENAVLGGVIFILVLSGLLGMPQALPRFLDGTVKEAIVLGSITRWSLPMLLVPAVHFYKDLGGCVDMTVTMLSSVYEGDMASSTFGVWKTSTIALIVQGVLLHLYAYLGLRFLYRSRQV